MPSTPSTTPRTKKIQWNDAELGSTIVCPFIGIEVAPKGNSYQSKINGVPLQKTFKSLDKAKAFALDAAITTLEKTLKSLKEVAK